MSEFTSDREDNLPNQHSRSTAMVASKKDTVHGLEFHDTLLSSPTVNTG